MVFLFNAETPQKPENVNIHPVRGQSSRVLTVQWNAPTNFDRFDLDYYKIQVLSLEQDEGDVLNVTSPNLEYPFGLVLNPPFPLHELTQNNLTVSAVSKCSQQGPEALATISIPSTINQDNVSTDRSNSTAMLVTVDPKFNGTACMHSLL